MLASKRQTDERLDIARVPSGPIARPVPGGFPPPGGLGPIGLGGGPTQTITRV
jgi:hypothetical protein